jgi:hypothetical protein
MRRLSKQGRLFFALILLGIFSSHNLVAEEKSKSREEQDVVFTATLPNGAVVEGQLSQETWEIKMLGTSWKPNDDHHYSLGGLYKFAHYQTAAKAGGCVVTQAYFQRNDSAVGADFLLSLRTSCPCEGFDEEIDATIVVPKPLTSIVFIDDEGATLHARIDLDEEKEELYIDGYVVKASVGSGLTFEPMTGIARLLFNLKDLGIEIGDSEVTNLALNVFYEYKNGVLLATIEKSSLDINTLACKTESRSIPGKP